MLIGIDPSTTYTGLAVGGQNDGSPKPIGWPLPGAADHVFDMTLAKVSESLGELCRLLNAEHVYIEQPLLIVGHQNAAHTTIALMQLTGAIRAAAKRAGANVLLVAVSTVRKHFVGQGNLKKHEAKRVVMERCRLLGWDHRGNDNLADSMAVWSYGMSVRYPNWAPKATPLFGRARA